MCSGAMCMVKGAQLDEFCSWTCWRACSSVPVPQARMCDENTPPPPSPQRVHKSNRPRSHLLYTSMARVHMHKLMAALLCLATLSVGAQKGRLLGVRPWEAGELSLFIRAHSHTACYLTIPDATHIPPPGLAQDPCAHHRPHTPDQVPSMVP